MGADPNGSAGTLTPLMYASYRDSLRIVQILLDYKADLTLITSEGLDALDYAMLYGNFSIAKFFIDHNGLKLRHSAE